MSHTTITEKKGPSFSDLVDTGVLTIGRAFGKGEDLRGSVWSIVAGTCNWMAQKQRDSEVMTRTQYEEKYGD